MVLATMAQGQSLDDALTEELLMPPEKVPAGGTFWSWQLPDQPPLPYNPFPTASVYLIDADTFLIDDRSVDYDALHEEQQLFLALQAATLGITVDELLYGASRTASASYTSGAAPYLLNPAATRVPNQTVMAGFDIAGGSINVPYDILATTNLAATPSAWTWIGVGYTSNRYTFTNQPSERTFYALGKPDHTMTVGWGDNREDQCDVPYGLTNAIAVAAGYRHSLALLSDGSVETWGDNLVGQGDVPPDVVAADMVAAGWYHSVALLTNGTVRAWGYTIPGAGWYLTNVPPGLTNVTVIAAQTLHTLALREDGTVVAWGYNDRGQTNVPAGLTNVVAIAAGLDHSLAARSDGTVVAWGGDGDGQSTVPTGLSNVVDVAAGIYHSLALRNDGTVVAWGGNAHGETDIPAGLTNVVAIAAGGIPNSTQSYSLALRSDGTVVKWGSGEVPVPVDGMNNVIAIAAGADHALAVRTGPPTPVITIVPEDQYQIAGGNVTFTSQGRGIYGVDYQWQFEGVNIPDATNASLTLNNVQNQDEGAYQVVVSDNIGSTVSSAAQFHLVTAPLILSQSQPTNPTVVYHTNVMLGVTVSAQGEDNGFPVSYQWSFNGTDIDGAYSASYGFYAELSGIYSVRVTNEAGGANAFWDLTVIYEGTYVAPGTLAYHLSTNATGRAAGYSGSSTDMKELSGWTYGWYYRTNLYLLTNAVWSPDFWLKNVNGLSATCIGFLNGLGGQGLVTMVSPRHCLFSSHTHLGQHHFVAAFLDTNNTVYWRTNMETVHLGDDVAVGILDSDLPPSVGFLPMAPTNTLDYLPTTSIDYVQGIGMNQDMAVFSQPMTFPSPHTVFWSSSHSPPLGLGTNWNVALRSGDSSAPERFLVGNQLVLISFNRSPGSGPFLPFYYGLINQGMHSLSTNNSAGTDYQLQPFPMTNWPVIH